MPQPKKLSEAAIPAALEKARHYRLLNEPQQAESICLDILAVEPEHQEALVTLILALTDQFRWRRTAGTREARELLERLSDEYQRLYYEGIIWERHGKAVHKTGGPGSGHHAHESLRRAMELYERAGEIRPEGNDDPILRWNTCVRIMERSPEIRPEPEDRFRPLLE